MRICLILPELFPYHTQGGIGFVARLLAEGLARFGHQVTVAGYEIHTEPEVHHGWGTSISYSHALAKSRIGRNDAGRSLLAAHAALRFVRRRRGDFDIVEASNWPGHGALLSFSGVPYVVRLSSPTKELGLEGRRITAINMLEQRSAAKANLLLGSTPSIADMVRKFYSASDTPIAIVPYGLPDIPQQPAPAAVAPVIVTYIGRAELRKGADLLIRAMARVMPQAPGLVLQIVGRFDGFADDDPSLASAWTALKRDYPDRVRQLGVCSEDEKIRLIASSHWLVIPSRYESFGIVAIEAMRAGTPLIAAEVGGLAYVAASPGTSLTYSDVGDEKQLAATLIKAYELGSEKALALRAKTRATFLELYGADEMVRKTVACYEAVITGRPVPYLLSGTPGEKMSAATEG